MRSPGNRPSGGLRRSHRLFRHGTHLANRSENGLFVYLPATLFAHPFDCPSVFPKGNRRQQCGSIRNLDVMVFVRVQHEDPAQVSGVTPDDKPVSPIAQSNPGLDGVACIDNVIDDETLPLNAPANHWQKIHEESSGIRCPR